MFQHQLAAMKSGRNCPWALGLRTSVWAIPGVFQLMFLTCIGKTETLASVGSLGVAGSWLFFSLRSSSRAEPASCLIHKCDSEQHRGGTSAESGSARLLLLVGPKASQPADPVPASQCPGSSHAPWRQR